MRALLPLLLAGCTAQAGIPGWSSGAAPSAAGGGTHTTDSTLAECEALTPSEGDTCSPTDAPWTLISRADGTWDYIHRNGGQGTPPTSSGWTDFDTGAGAHTSGNTGGGRQLHVAPGQTGGLIHGEYRALAADPATTGSYYIFGLSAGGSGSAPGLGFLRVNGNIATATGDCIAGEPTALQVSRFFTTSGNTAFGGYYTQTVTMRHNGPIWWGLELTTTERNVYYSTDRVNWTEIQKTAGGVVALTDNLGGNPDAVFWSAPTAGSAVGAVAELWDYQEGSGTLPTTLP